MADLTRQLIAETIVAPGLAIAIDQPARIFLVAGPGLTPNTAIGTDPVALWLAPNRRLLVAETDVPPPDAAFVSDVTDGFVRIVITGPRLPDVIAMATTLNPSILAPGSCAQTQWAGVKLLLHPTTDGLHLYVERPLAPWLLGWFRAAITAFA